MWAEKRDSGVLEPCVSPFVGKNKPKTMHNVVFCDQSYVLTRLRSLDRVRFVQEDLLHQPHEPAESV